MAAMRTNAAPSSAATPRCPIQLDCMSPLPTEQQGPPKGCDCAAWLSLWPGTPLAYFACFLTSTSRSLAALPTRSRR